MKKLNSQQYINIKIKNYYASVALLALMSASSILQAMQSDNYSQLDDLEKKALHSKLKITSGYGYRMVVPGSLNDEHIKIEEGNPCITLTQEPIPDYSAPNFEEMYHYSLHHQAHEFRKSTSLDFNAKASYLGIGELAAQYSQREEFLKQGSNTTINYLCKVDIKKVVLKLPRGSIKLDAHIENEIRDIMKCVGTHSVPDWHDRHQFQKLLNILDHYGPVIPTTYGIGASYFFEEKTSKASYQEVEAHENSFKAALSITLGFWGASAGGGVANSGGSTNQNLHIKHSIHTSVKGGDEQYKGNIPKWIESVGLKENWRVVEKKDYLWLFDLLEDNLKTHVNILINKFHPHEYSLKALQHSAFRFDQIMRKNIPLDCFNKFSEILNDEINKLICYQHKVANDKNKNYSLNYLLGSVKGDFHLHHLHNKIENMYNTQGNNQCRDEIAGHYLNMLPFNIYHDIHHKKTHELKDYINLSLEWRFRAYHLLNGHFHQKDNNFWTYY